MDDFQALNDISSDILDAIVTMREKFPELYRDLDETPPVNADYQHELCLSDFKEFLSTIQAQVDKQSSV